ncbi:MAG: hypothetical protein KGH75_12610, partial [Rhodospirillales bacterium]|nr:hypothetical protein [Rhodospirillales bacterium]MDE3023717.1 hypothetical protein [Pseudomonadota bacterium]
MAETPLVPQPYTQPIYTPAPYYPPVATQLLPRAYLDGQIQALGVRLGWMKGHNCPCSYGYDMTGTP